MIVGSIGKINSLKPNHIIIFSLEFSLTHPSSFLLSGSTFAPLVKLTDLNPLMLLTGLGIFGYLLTLKLDENDGMRDYLEKENVSLPVIKKPEADVSI